MVSVLFKEVPLSERSFFQKLFNQQPPENAVKEVNNILARKELSYITAQDIEAIEHRYNLNLLSEFKLNLEEFYAVYFNQCIKDRIISADEARELSRLQSILKLDDSTVAALQEKIGAVVYRQTFEEAVSGRRLSRSSQRILADLTATLRLPAAVTDKISKESRLKVINDYVTAIIAKQQFSEADENELGTIAESLQINIKIDKENQAIFDKLKLYWRLEHLELEKIPVDTPLQKGEDCHLVIRNVAWHEPRGANRQLHHTHTVPAGSVKKFFLEDKNIMGRNLAAAHMRLIDTGTVYLTNKRILFVTAAKNSNIRLEKILNIRPFTDGVEIEKDAGKCPLLILPEPADVFCIMLERLIRGAL